MKAALTELIERLEKEAEATKNPAIEIGILRSCKIATELLEKEREIAQDYARFAIECDRKGMPILEFQDWIKL